MDTRQTALGDIPVDGWVDRYAPATLRPYLRLMRLDRPIGIWLLLLPGWWSIALAGGGWQAYLLFGVGAVVMRGAGCIINDVIDRDLDAQVARTAGRPLAAGTLNLSQAILFMVGLLASGLVILLQFDHATILLGLASIPFVCLYPLMKRMTDWPQAWLGITFNWGALLGWSAVEGRLAAPAFLLYGAGFLWTLGYDTIYAHQDKEDDALVGIRSTARRLGDRSPTWIAVFYAGTMALLAAGAGSASVGPLFWPVLAAAGLHLGWQVTTLEIASASDCLVKFRSNRVFGWLVLAAIVAGKSV